MIEVKSLSDFLNREKRSKKNYLLLANSLNDNSKCAIKSISEAQNAVEGTIVFYADTSKVFDIHTEYNITSTPSLLEFNGTSLKNVIKGCNNELHYKAIFEETIYNSDKKNNTSPEKRVTIYSTPTCSWCITLKNYLKLHGIKYVDIDVSTNQKAANDLIKRSGQMGVPQTDINGEIIIGFDKQRINQLLNIKG